MSTQEDIEKAIKEHDLYSVAEWLPSDWEQAFNQYLPMAEAGDAQAQFNVAYCYARGDVMDQDFEKAFEWYQKAADKGDPRAHYNLSQMYERGESVIPDSIKARELFNRALELGDVRPQNRTALANAKEALKRGERDKARSLFSMVSSTNKEAESGIIACDVLLKSVYRIKINYSYHSSGSESNRKHWKWADSTSTDIDVTMTNNSVQSWHVLVRALCKTKDGVFIGSKIEGVLRSKETISNIVKLADYGGASLCGVEIFQDPEGSLDRPSFKFFFPEMELKPDAEETINLQHKIAQVEEEMKRQNKNAKPGGCFVLTACYGSYDAPVVYAFRQFRDQHLAQSKAGRRFIAWYYTHGPRWAEFISDRPRVKAVLRAAFNRLAKILPR